jgi:hypothetical protein
MAFENQLDFEKYWNGNIENGKPCFVCNRDQIITVLVA